ncbi:MAG: HAD family hydrolase [Candidatus Thorarchaeota archaeon]|nr:HAD family hydrolase [Candidatus Thorarchaeota archaeon]
MLRAALFDLDGTITVLTLPLDAMRSDTKKYYIDHGMPSSLIEPADGISSTRVKAREYFFTHGVTDAEWERMEHEVDALLSRHEGDAAWDARLISGTLDVVTEIRKLGIKTAILTNNGRQAVDIILSHLPLQDYFDLIQTRNESPNPKPYPDGILHVLKRLGVSVDEAVYIGDAQIDAAAARRAGIPFWAVATGETPKETLQEAGADRVFDNLRDILPVIRQLI